MDGWMDIANCSFHLWCLKFKDTIIAVVSESQVTVFQTAGAILRVVFEIWRVNLIDVVGGFARVIPKEVFMTRFRVSLFCAALPCLLSSPYYSRTANAFWLMSGVYLFSLRRPREGAHWCINTHVCAWLSAQMHMAVHRLEAVRSFTLQALRPPRSWPTFFSPLVTPSLIAAQHTEAICSTEACHHGDAGRLYGFAVNWPTGKWRSGDGGRVWDNHSGPRTVLLMAQ